MIKFCVLFIVFFSNSLFSQEAERKFVINLMEEGILEIKDRKTNQKKYDMSLIEIDFDTVKSSSYYFNENFRIYKFNLDKNNVKYDSSKFLALFNSSYCNTYILALDSENNSYKLLGFQKNDILFFLNATRKIFPDYRTKDILKFLKNNFNDLDFNCMYNSIKQEKFQEKCIKPCSDGIRSH